MNTNGSQAFLVHGILTTMSRGTSTAIPRTLQLQYAEFCLGHFNFKRVLGHLEGDRRTLGVGLLNTSVSCNTGWEPQLYSLDTILKDYTIVITMTFI